MAAEAAFAAAVAILGNELRSIYREDVGQGYTSAEPELDFVAERPSPSWLLSARRRPASRAAVRLAVSPLSLRSRVRSRFRPVSSSPTVSPYLNLFREDFDGGGDFNYQTLVRPQFQQMATNQQFQRQNHGTLAARSDDLGPKRVSESGRFRDTCIRPAIKPRSDTTAATIPA